MLRQYGHYNYITTTQQHPNKLCCVLFGYEVILLYVFIHLKVPKCENFHLFDFNEFYGVKSL